MRLWSPSESIFETKLRPFCSEGFVCFFSQLNFLLFRSFRFFGSWIFCLSITSPLPTLLLDVEGSWMAIEAESVLSFVSQGEVNASKGVSIGGDCGGGGGGWH